MKKVVKTITKEVVFYVASDGKEFEDKWDCQDYEFEMEYERKVREANHLKYDANKLDWPSMADHIRIMSVFGLGSKTRKI